MYLYGYDVDCKNPSSTAGRATNMETNPPDLTDIGEEYFYSHLFERNE